MTRRTHGVRRHLAALLLGTVGALAPAASQDRATATEDAASAGLTAESRRPVAELAALRHVLDRRGLRGTVLVYEPRRDAYAAVYAERADLRLIPASTFKILNSLAALDAGAIEDGQTVVPWDGVVRERRELNRDLSLQQAFAVSSVPVYQHLARRIGPERMQRYLDAVGYGNRDMSGGIDRFWLDGGLRISPREQVDVLVRLYDGRLPFEPRALAIVRDLMIAADSSGTHVLRAKTGWAQPGGGRQIGWWVGWVERDTHATFFATAIESDEPRDDFGPARLAVTREVLAALGVLPTP